MLAEPEVMKGYLVSASVDMENIICQFKTKFQKNLDAWERKAEPEGFVSGEDANEIQEMMNEAERFSFKVLLMLDSLGEARDKIALYEQGVKTKNGSAFNNANPNDVVETLCEIFSQIIEVGGIEALTVG